jgi:two-component system response regulator AtoC
MADQLLIVEDDSQLNEMLALHFEEAGFEVAGALTCEQAERLMSDRPPDLVLLDQQLPDGTGLELLTQIQKQHPEQPVIMMTGRHDLELAIEAIKAGASDFIHKPIDTKALEQVVARVLENHRLSQQLEAKVHQDVPNRGVLIGRGEAMLRVSKEIGLSAGTDAPVLITGESGTGKEVVARLIHMHSRRTGDFVAVNCAAIVDTLLESELFGHEKGAFTGAAYRKPGKFELADNGTLFLDEVGELALPLQAKLLRALQERVFERVGGTEQIRTNARVIAATNRDLQEEVARKRFRDDLMYRLNVIAIHLPALRERQVDIPLLTRALLGKICRRMHRPMARVSDAALARLEGYSWPGNVRELENVLTKAVVHARGQVVTPDLIEVSGAPGGLESPAESEAQVLRTLEQVEAEHIQRVLEYTGGHKGRSCAILKISRPALDRKIARYGLEVPGKSG